MPLSDIENCAIGVTCGVADVLLLQPTNYWKNAAQQNLPFTLNPTLLYRGVVANAFNNGTVSDTPRSSATAHHHRHRHHYRHRYRRRRSHQQQHCLH